MAFSPPTRRTTVAAGAAAWLAACSAKAGGGGVRLAEAAASRGRLFGAAIEPDKVDGDPAFAALLRAQCASLTPENAMKWGVLQPRADAPYDFASADRVVEIAQAQGAAVHGHCLVWHEAMPEGLAAALGSGLSQAGARALLETHIRRVAGRYAGRVRAWDVVNEAVERNDRRPDGLRRSPWLQALGPDYLALAFRSARAADPKARLALADYGLEYDDESWMREKRGTLLDLLRGLKAAQVPIDALSIQGHLLGDRPPAFGAGLRAFLRDVAALGLEIYVTELDVSDQHVDGGIDVRDRRIAEIYRSFAQAVTAEPAVKSIATWGLSDRYTSKTDMFPRPDGSGVRPLPFDASLSPKPAAVSLDAALRGA